MITLKASIAGAILFGAVGAAAAATYTVTRMSVDVTCPAAAADDHRASEDAAMQRFTSGKPLPTDQGRKF
jgi:hypothetical protein